MEIILFRKIYVSLQQKTIKTYYMKYVIIGGVAGGATAAARLRRVDEQSDIVLLERGKYIYRRA